MTKTEFLDAFKQASDALPFELVNSAIADYERQFTEQFLAGVSEEIIVERWGTPQHAALKLKLSSFNGTLKKTVSVEKVARVGMSGVGLVIMDFFLFIPATIYMCLLLGFYAVSVVVYLCGIFVTASSAAGVNYIDVPAYYLPHDASIRGSTHLDLGNIDIVPTEIASAEKPTVSGNATSASGLQEKISHEPGFHVATHLSKGTIWKGVTTTVSGMILLVLCFLATRFTYRMIRQFVSWHFSVLKNA